MMDSCEVIKLYSELENLGIEVWINGGWGVDALLGKQTRVHADLDIFIQEKDASKLRSLLESQAYKEIKIEIARTFNYVLADDAGHEVDIHVINLDDKGKFSYGGGKSAEVYPVATLGGVGVINGVEVRCISLEWVMRWHTGYKPREIDFSDVLALCQKFKINVPKEYTR